jgi:hypothetical protein
MRDELLAFVAPPHDGSGLEIRVNFGVFAGREATPAEIDELAGAIVPSVGEVTIVAEQRHEISDEVEASLHQVRVEVAPRNLPRDLDDRGTLAEELLEVCEGWARRAIEMRHVEL